jgi:hypothetical protein
MVGLPFFDAQPVCAGSGHFVRDIGTFRHILRSRAFAIALGHAWPPKSVKAVEIILVQTP